MKNTPFKVGDVFGDILGKKEISMEQITKLNILYIQNVDKLI